MTVLIICLFVALAIVAWRRHQAPSRVLNTVTAVLAVGCLAAVAFAWHQPAMEAERHAANVDRVQEAIGFKLGQTVAQAFPQGGDVLVLVDGLSAQLPTDSRVAVELKGLQAGFGSQNLHAILYNYQPASTTEALEQANWVRNGVPLEKINEWFEGHNGAVAVVSFTLVGLGPRGELPTHIPPLFTFGPPNMENWIELIKPDALKAVVVSRSGFNWATVADPSLLADVFQNCCEMITPANVAEARAHLGGGTQ